MNKIKISVVIATYKGSNRIKDCLDSLLKQSLNKNVYEVLIIDDASNDDIADKVKEFNDERVKLIIQKQNKGAYVARNVGLRQAKGRIVAYTDDDCIASENWLESLLSGYNKDDVIAVGGMTLPFDTGRISEKYMAAIEYGNPAPISYAQTSNIIFKFIAYVKDMYMPISNNLIVQSEVSAIYTLNASYLKEVLLEVGGWDEKLRYGGDAEMSIRIKKKYPTKKILFDRKAIIWHKHRTKFSKFISDMYFRAPDKVKYYKKHNLVPPILPFPLLFIGLTIVSLIILPFLLTIMILLILPLLIYFWWILRAVQQKKMYYFIFPYMQLLHESAATFGILKSISNL